MAQKAYMSRITAKGQTTIPVEVRELMKIGAGDTIQFVWVDGRFELIPRNRSVSDLFGRLEKYAIENTPVRAYREALGDYFGRAVDRPEKEAAA